MRIIHSSTLQRRHGSWTSVVAAMIGTLASLQGSAADKTAADYLVESLPGQPDGPLLKMHAGHIEITPKHNGNLFFWHYANRHIGSRQRTVIWLNGGPGCSSMDGALMEIGPYRVEEGGNLAYNNGSWDQWANLLFVDNPVGTGFSYVDTNSYVHELPQMANQFVTFLEKWFDLFPQYLHDDLYIAGESYAGQYIPHIARAILDRNKKKYKPWNLSGLLIGNGWISPEDQYLAYLPFAYEHDLIKEDSNEAKQVESSQHSCVKALKDADQESVDLPTCEGILRTILRVTTDRSLDKSCINMYDVRLRDESPACGMNWPPDLATVTPYLRRSEVLTALHINKDKKTAWTECNGGVSGGFTARNSKPSIDLLPALLAEVPILLFSGNQDLICNHIGTEMLIEELKWQGYKGWNLPEGGTAPRRNWFVNDEPAGFYQEARNLTYVLFYDSSHMVPFDYPERSRDMLHRFIGLDLDGLMQEQVVSSIDGEGGSSLTNGSSSVGSSKANEAEKDRVEEATKNAYYRSGEVALVIVALAAAAWGVFVWRGRRRRSGYRGVGGDDGMTGARMESFRNARPVNDEEAAQFALDDEDVFSSDDEDGERIKMRDEEGGPRRYSLDGASGSSEGGTGAASREKLVGNNR